MTCHLIFCVFFASISVEKHCKYARFWVWEIYLVFIFWSENRKVYVKIQYRKSSINTIFLLSKIHIRWIVKIEKSGWKCNFLQKISNKCAKFTQHEFSRTRKLRYKWGLAIYSILDMCARNHYARQTYDMSKYMREINCRRLWNDDACVADDL